MALTICTVGPDGVPDDELDIGGHTHELVQEEAARLGLFLLARMHEYYDDAEYSVEEVPSLIREAEALRDHGSDRIAPWLTNLIALASRAVQKNLGLEVISD